jgi:hypothetical protein
VRSFWEVGEHASPGPVAAFEHGEAGLNLGKCRSHDERAIYFPSFSSASGEMPAAITNMVVRTCILGPLELTRSKRAVR